MNLAEALNVALPDIPARSLPRDRPPKLDPNLIVKEQIHDGQPKIMILIPTTRVYYPITPEQWELLSLFDGNRTYPEIAEILTLRTSTLYSEDYVREFAESVASEPLWVKTAQEQNIALWEKLKEERRRRTKPKSRWGNLAEITFSAWDPNAFLTRVYEKLRFVFTRKFLILNLALFTFMAWVWIDRWGEIAHDSVEYFVFTDKGFADILEFWVLMFFVGFVHETAHGLACKHTGGEVHRMGFLLIYLSPAFFCDTTEAWVFGSKWQRIFTAAAGLWAELILCGFATILWWGLPPGGFVHEIAYKIILVAGLALILINLNPLVKLDGYFIFTEMLEISELKELSTGFTTSWIKKRIFRLPVEVPYTPWRRKLLFVPYSVLSGVYSYLMLFFGITFVYNLVYKYNSQWAFLPALVLALLIFRSRLRSGLRFLRSVYLDKKELFVSQLRSRRSWVAGALLLCLFFAPWWRETVSGRFVLEAARKSMVRAHVPGRIVEVNAAEGDAVQAGAPLAKLADLKLDSELARLTAEYQSAAARVVAARLRNNEYAAIEHERDELATRLRLLREQDVQLILTSEISGLLVTPRLSDRIGDYIAAGTEVAEVADLSELRARIYIAESDLPKICTGTVATLHASGHLPLMGGTVVAIAPATSAMEAGVMEKEKYIGLHAPHYYFVDIAVPNIDGSLRIGMTGEAKVFVKRRSIAALLSEAVANFVARKLW